MTRALTIWIASSLSGNSASAATIARTQLCVIPASPAEADNDGRKSSGQRGDSAQVYSRGVSANRAMEPGSQAPSRARNMLQLQDAFG